MQKPTAAGVCALVLALAAALVCAQDVAPTSTRPANQPGNQPPPRPVSLDRPVPDIPPETDTGETPVTLPPAAAPTEPTSAPASRPSPEPPNPRRTPLKMMEYFLAAVVDSEDDPDRLADAVRCLDLTQLDEDTAEEKGGLYARQLGRLIRELESSGAFNWTDLPDEPAAETQVIGRDPILLVMERHERSWRFAASTVVEIPQLLAAAEAIATGPPSDSSPASSGSAPSAAEPVEGFRTPRELVRHFLVSLSEAEDDPDRYVDAIACLNFAAVDPATAEEHCVQYAEQFGEILESFLDSGTLTVDALPNEPDAAPVTLGSDPVMVILTQLVDGRWQVAARTVAQIPAMYQALRDRPAVAGGTDGSAAARVGQSAKSASVPPEFRSPRATMDTFLRAMAESDLRAAARCLDLSALSVAERDANSWLLAGKLLLVLRRNAVIVLQGIPDDPDFAGPYKYLLNRYGRVEIERQNEGDRVGEWLFSKASVRSIERLYEAWQTRPILPEYRNAPGIAFRLLPSLWLRERVIPPGFQRTAFGLQYWQWLGLLLVLVAGWAVQRLASWGLPRLVRRALFARVPSGFVFDPKVLRPVAFLALVVTWWGGVQLLDLGARVVGVIWPAMRLLLVAAGAWAVYRSIDLATDYSAAHAARREVRLNDVLVPLVRKTLKVLVVAVGATMVLTVLGFEVAPLLAGLGIGGLAFSFAAKDTIANFFGSVNVVLDRPFQVGDFVKINGHEGTVESVGLRSTRLRTVHDSQLTIPNAEIMIATIDNLGRRRYRRTSLTLSVTYRTTPAQIEALCEGVRELIRRHPHTRRDEYQVYLSALGESSIDILVNCFHLTPDWDGELCERHRLLLDIMRLADRLGVEFAYPTRTIQMETPSAGSPAAVVKTGVADQRSLAAPADIEAAMKLGRDQAAAIAQEPQKR